MPKIMYVTKVYEVVIPDDRTEIFAAIDRDNHPEDAAIVKASDEAIATYMSYNMIEHGVDIVDTHVSDLQPDLDEFTLKDLGE